MTSAVRLPAVAGRFYPARPDRLLREIEQYTSPPASRVPAIGCVAPHAGYMYSGHVAGALYARIEVPEHCIILCPNHTGRGAPLSIMAATTWQTPLGNVAPSSALASQLLQCFPQLEEDSAAHHAEHAIEVQLPFLQAQQKHLHLVPIALGTRDFHALRELGEAIASVIAKHEDSGQNVLIVASSDMNHYEPDAITRIKDHKAIDRVLALDARGLWEVVMREDVSMCGFGPAVAMLTAAKILGATQAQVVRYATSGDISGDRDEVVGYAGILVH